MNETNEFKEYLIENIGPSYIQALDRILNNINTSLWYTHLSLMYQLNIIEGNSVDFRDKDIISYTLAYVISVRDKFGISIWWCDGDNKQYYLITSKLTSPSIIKKALNENKLYLIDKNGKARMVL
ncbi:MAG: hypothetical protein SO009_03755 [Bacilli bacterium]|nr:hypothetical protein [Bacilli bacterium]